MNLFNYLKESGVLTDNIIYSNSDCGLISASSIFNTDEINKELNSNLKSELIKLGYSIIEKDAIVQINYKTSSQKELKTKYFVVVDPNHTNKLKMNLVKLGKRYLQDFVIYYNVDSNYYFIIGTNATGYPGFNNVKSFKGALLSDNGLIKNDINDNLIKFR